MANSKNFERDTLQRKMRASIIKMVKISFSFIIYIFCDVKGHRTFFLQAVGTFFHPYGAFYAFICSSILQQEQKVPMNKTLKKKVKKDEK